LGVVLCLIAEPAAAITLQVDYTYDTSNFFGNGNPQGATAGAQAKAALEAAASFYSTILTDSFSAIQTPPQFHSSQGTGVWTWHWTENFNNPSTNSSVVVTDATIGTWSSSCSEPAPQRACGARPALDWWRGFGSRELTLLMEEAQTANLDIAVAVARIQQADAQVKITNAALLPVLDANFNAQRSRTPGLGGAQSRVSSLYNFNLTASYTLDFWGRNRALLLADVETAISTRYAKEVIALTTLVSAANAYFNVLDAQDRLRIARENFRASSRVLDLIRQRKGAGTASDLEVSQQESLVAQQRASVPPLEIIVRQNKMALAVLVGRAPEHFLLAGGSANRIRIPRVAPGLPSDLLDQRPDIREAEDNL